MSKPPKVKCCVSKSRCSRCPIRMLKEGTLPDGYGVKKRRLVRIDPDGTVHTVKKKDKELEKAAKQAAAQKSRKKSDKKAGKKKKSQDSLAA